MEKTTYKLAGGTLLQELDTFKDHKGNDEVTIAKKKYTVRGVKKSISGENKTALYILQEPESK